MPRVCESECRRVKDRERGGKRLLHSLQFRTVASILHIRRLIGVCSHVTGISRDPTYTHCDMWLLWGGCANHTTMRWTIWFLREKKKDCGKRQRKGEVKKKSKGKKQGSFVCRSPVGLSVCIIKKTGTSPLLKFKLVIQNSRIYRPGKKHSYDECCHTLCSNTHT